MIRRFFVLLALPGLTLLGVSGCSKPALDPAVVAKHRTARRCKRSQMGPKLCWKSAR